MPVVLRNLGIFYVLTIAAFYVDKKSDEKLNFTSQDNSIHSPIQRDSIGRPSRFSTKLRPSIRAFSNLSPS